MFSYIKDVIGVPYCKECSSEKDFEDNIIKLFNKANEEILISTSFSGGSKGFYGRERAKIALENAIKRGVAVKIILDKDADSPPEWIKENKSIELKQSKEKIRHVIVVDRKHLRLETPHEKGKTYNATNHVCYNDPLTATRWYSRFIKLWDSTIVEDYPREEKKEKL